MESQGLSQIPGKQENRKGKNDENDQYEMLTAKEVASSIHAIACMVHPMHNKGGGKRCSCYWHLQVHPKPPLSNENLLINELIREYMIYNGYRESLSVFVPETGQPQLRPFDRSMMAESLHINEGPNSRQLPLLYTLVKGAQEPKAK
ncbi:hypothetical protein DUNSADRAFT_194 [Dunaliella salina]|uniref:FGFR1 oncogene partner (FOP) N-terminal dimerisation domain-containing protein n=1 Tax=Dunaliella salina TaxID=3046 RepID=A0ABQ7FZB3_DUNSA|nr:hypothetical protein DUNSADRAFT_194 [Dunaliella salina]|eukprot:KAF5827697.1 hypothetical protein DUNSADRAFT_194 [Dunaliella salina]